MEKPTKTCKKFKQFQPGYSEEILNLDIQLVTATLNC